MTALASAPAPAAEFEDSHALRPVVNGRISRSIKIIIDGETSVVDIAVQVAPLLERIVDGFADQRFRYDRALVFHKPCVQVVQYGTTEYLPQSTGVFNDRHAIGRFAARQLFNVIQLGDESQRSSLVFGVRYQ
jgi:hypothetical protein